MSVRLAWTARKAGSTHSVRVRSSHSRVARMTTRWLARKTRLTCHRVMSSVFGTTRKAWMVLSPVVSILLAKGWVAWISILVHSHHIRRLAMVTRRPPMARWYSTLPGHLSSCRARAASWLYSSILARFFGSLSRFSATFSKIRKGALR